MSDEHLELVKDLAYLKWELLANELAKENGLITTSMYEFARDALQKEIAALEFLCYNHAREGGNSGTEICTATA